MRLVAAVRMLLGVGTLGPDEILEELFEEGLIGPTLQLASGLPEGSPKRKEMESQVADLKLLLKQDWFDKRAEDTARVTFRKLKARGFIGSEEDLVGEVASHIWGKSLKQLFPKESPGNIDTGRIQATYSTIVKNAIGDVVKKVLRMTKYEEREPTDVPLSEMSESGVRPQETLDDVSEETLRKQIAHYIESKKGKGSPEAVIAEVWMERSREEAGRYDIFSDIYSDPRVKELKTKSGEAYPLHVIREAYRNVKRMILDFMKRVMGARPSQHAERNIMVAGVGYSLLDIVRSHRRMASMALFGLDGSFRTPEEIVAEIREEED